MELMMPSLMKNIKNMKNVDDSRPARMRDAGREEVFQYLEKVMKLIYFICSLPGCKVIRGKAGSGGWPAQSPRIVKGDYRRLL
jgi:hypothetical protein